MWIRSQNQENYLDASGKTFSIYNGNQIHLKYANSSIFLGKYSSYTKTLKVLDMLRKQNDKSRKTIMIYLSTTITLNINIIKT